MTGLLGLVSICVGTGITCLQGSIPILDPASCEKSIPRSKQTGAKVRASKSAKSARVQYPDHHGAHEIAGDGYLDNRGSAFLLIGMLTAKV